MTALVKLSVGLLGLFFAIGCKKDSAGSASLQSRPVGGEASASVITSKNEYCLLESLIRKGVAVPKDTYLIGQNTECAMELQNDSAPILLIMRGFKWDNGPGKPMGAVSSLEVKINDKSFSLKDFEISGAGFWMPPGRNSFSINVGTIENNSYLPEHKARIQIEVQVRENAGVVGNECKGKVHPPGKGFVSGIFVSDRNIQTKDGVKYTSICKTNGNEASNESEESFIANQPPTNVPDNSATNPKHPVAQVEPNMVPIDECASNIYRDATEQVKFCLGKPGNTCTYCVRICAGEQGKGPEERRCR